MKEKWILPTLIGVFFALSRWPGVLPWNLSAAYALFFCAGAFRKQFPLWFPFVALFLSDLGLNLFYYRVAPISAYALVTYLSFLCLYLLGRSFKPSNPWWKLASGGVLGALLFYLISNTASWLYNPMYAKTFQGWLQALSVGEAGWPQTWMFFRNTLLGGGLFTALFSLAFQSSLAKQEEEEAEELEETEVETSRETDGELEPEEAT